ncbi:hypothetical protein D3C72_404330 [compost metagenome]
MTRFDEVQHTVTGWLGIRQKTPWERITGMDWQGLMPSRQDVRGLVPHRHTLSRPNIDTTSLVVGLIVGVGIGVGVGYALAQDVRPSVRQARRQVRQAMSKVEDNLREVPSRLNITRMEEQKSK